MPTAQQHTDALISALLSSRGRPAEAAALQQYLDDAHAVARCRLSRQRDGRSPGHCRRGPGRTRCTARTRPRRQLAPVTAFGVTIADTMLHSRHEDPDPDIAGWFAGNTASRRNTTSPRTSTSRATGPRSR